MMQRKPKLVEQTYQVDILPPGVYNLHNEMTSHNHLIQTSTNCCPINGSSTPKTNEIKSCDKGMRDFLLKRRRQKKDIEYSRDTHEE